MSFSLRPFASVLLAVATSALLPVCAEAQQERFPGLSWRPPSGMEETDAWSVACPSRCVMYEGAARDEDWPLIIVHEPIPGTFETFRKMWIAAQARDNPEAVTESLGIEAGRLKNERRIEVSMYDLKDDADDDSPQAAVLLLLEQDGVIVPVEVYGYDIENVSARLSAASNFLETMRLDPASVKSARAKVDTQISALTAAMNAGYARGEKATLFMNVETGVRNTWTLGGMELLAYREENILAFLPGGVLLEEAPSEGYRRPDLKRLFDTNRLGSWSAVPGGFSVKHADGRSATYKFGAKDGNARTLKGPDFNWTEVPRYTVGELAGTYETIDTASAGGMGTGLPTAIFSRADQFLTLTSNRRFEMRREAQTLVSGPNIGGGTSSEETIKGSWTYDPAAYTISLVPDDGSPPIEGPFHGGPGTTPSQMKPGESLDWRVLDGERWWKSK